MTREGGEIEIERRIAASPQTVFSYLVDPVKFVSWMGTGAELDARPGGAYRLQVDPGQVAVGEYLEIDPPHRLRFTWGWEGDARVPGGSTTVEITLQPDGAATLLRLRHFGLPEGEARSRHGEGWWFFTGRLAALFG